MKQKPKFLTTALFMALMAFVGCLALPQTLLAGNGFMGGKGKIKVEDPAGGDTGIPDTVVGPLNDKGSDKGKLFGDLYKILRYQGGETKRVPEVDANGDPVCDTGNCSDPGAQQALVDGGPAVGGEPVLSQAYGQYALEVAEGVYQLAYAPYPCQCVQPVAGYDKWGEINGLTGLDHNRLPLIMVYDAQWKRTECEVGQLIGEQVVNPSTGAFETPDCSDTITQNCIERYFMPPSPICPAGVSWSDLVDEVHFGRLNLSRSPEAVLQAAFDEAIAAINSPDTVAISRDAAGRLLLTKKAYSETEVDECGDPLLLDQLIVKAIDSPRENLALYVKLMQDGHLVTPGDERAPIDRSKNGGIPLWKLLELSDGPSDALRPTVNIDKLGTVFPSLVDVTPTTYATYYECYNAAGAVVPCLQEVIGHDGTPKMVAGDDVASRELLAVDACPDPAVNPNAASCIEGWVGIKTDDGGAATAADFDFAAAFLAAAADKTGKIGPDMVVYLNSILGINQVVGYSAYNEDGTPATDAVNYSQHPVYFNYAANTGYSRPATIGARDGGRVTVLQKGIGSWVETDVHMINDGVIAYRNQAASPPLGHPNTSTPAADDILGFTQMADDDLRIVDFVHTYQIPELR